jgi:hypothetical protein
MLAGDSPPEIINWLVTNDANNMPNSRKYGIAFLSIGSALGVNTHVHRPLGSTHHSMRLMRTPILLNIPLWYVWNPKVLIWLVAISVLGIHWGQLVLYGHLPRSENSIDVSALPTVIYFFEWVTLQSRSVKKIVKN